MTRRLLWAPLLAVVVTTTVATSVLALPGNITLVSTSDTGVKANIDSSGGLMSADGSKVAFSTFATNLDPADNDKARDVYVKDITTGDLTLASISAAGANGSIEDTATSISADGTKVAFRSFATNFDPRDTDSASDIYVKDLATGNLTLVSTSDAGVKGNFESTAAALSADGTKVAFSSAADNLDPADTNSARDVYLKDLTTGDLTLVSTSDAGVIGNSASTDAGISADGTKVSFSSGSTNLDPGDTDSTGDVYVKDLTTGDLTLVSTSDTGVKGSGGSPSISDDGTRVAFVSSATNLDPGDTDSPLDVYVKDLTTGDVTLASTSDTGVKGNVVSNSPHISGDGTKVLFNSLANNFDPRDTVGWDIYVKDLMTGDLMLASTSDAGVKGQRDSFGGSISADGTLVAFQSFSRNLDPADMDGVPDIYLKELGEPPPSANLLLTNSDKPDPATVGASLTYKISVRNLGPDTATGVMLTDELPAGVTFVSGQPQQGTCSQVGGIVTCDLGSLANGGRTNINIRVTPTAPGSLSNTASVAANEADSNTANNQATATTTVQ